MNTQSRTYLLKGAWWIGLAIIILIGGVTSSRWIPGLNSWVEQTISSFRPGEAGTDDESHEPHDSHEGHDHESHAGHQDETSLELSAQAMRNIGLTEETLLPVQLETFWRSMTVPAVIVERPGRTRVQVATPMTGVITDVHAVEGEAVEPGTLLFQIRLTHEDLVQAQTEFLKTLGELDVEEREIKRLEAVTSSGAVAGKLLLDREYARDKLSALLRAQREALRLHGLSEGQVNQIAEDRRLLRELQVFAPTIDNHEPEELQLTRSADQNSALEFDSFPPETKFVTHVGPLILQDLNVHKGQSVNAGETLCVLTDYDELLIEGMAFEQDFETIRETSKNQWPVDAIFEKAGDGNRIVEGLEIAYLANQVDTGSRTLKFYVRLRNELVKDRRDSGNRYVEWKYLPGQRLQLRIPIEEWPEQIVVPVDAIAREGVESFVFQQNGDHFDRVPVHVKYRDQFSVVIANDGSLYPGDVIATKGAHQMQMALKNKSGGGVDPHAGHNH
ncbi:Multidrug resistance protein MdtA [Thalassoglobus neptunius]|uniref:Multidrug resistance protein MdtA n=1 Tax=Thalassoglobus neptunius TaxID=1938619 RepID=A0A5C5WNV1_9PLAN|nr:efflux RND transporter periplasmic adaptor subunit [Thalassoglobus neptunius]TWT51693.1 Multidrug resistance protein MdtA [Thalassoglobus neptunius]